MRLISRHILRSLAPPFGWGLAALVGLLLLNQLAPLIDRFGGKGLPASVMVEAVALQLPALLVLSLPMAVLVSTLYGYSQLAGDLEMVAMYANGISVWRMARPALIAAIGVALVNFLLYDQVVPRSNARFTALQRDVGLKNPTLAFRAQLLNPVQSTAYVLRARDIDPTTGRLLDVTIYDMSSYDGRRVIYADSGWMAESSSGEDLLLTLRQGEIFDFKRNEPDRLERTKFTENRVRIRDVNNELRRNDDHFDRGQRELSGCELLDAIADAKWHIADGRQLGEYYTRRDLRSLSGLPPLQPPAAQLKPTFPPHCSGSYRRLERWFQGVMLPQKLQAEAIPREGTQQPVQPPQQPAVSPGALAPISPIQSPTPFLIPPVQTVTHNGLATGVAEVSSAMAEAKYASRDMLGYSVEYQKKFAIPLASFCFVLLGMALALKYPRSGIGLVIGASLVIFLGFYILLIGGQNVAEKGYLSPTLAIQGPLILLTAIGLLAVHSANREMGTARSAGIFDAILGIFRAKDQESQE